MTTKDTKEATNKEVTNPVDHDTVTVSRVELDKLINRVASLEAKPAAVSSGDSLEVAVLRKRVAELETVRNDADSPTTRVLTRTCNSCGYELEEGENTCPYHPTEYVNHLGVGIDPESMLKRQVIVRQTRA